MTFLVEPFNYEKSFGPGCNSNASDPCPRDSCDCHEADICPAQYW